jgi:hypothetical protein
MRKLSRALMLGAAVFLKGIATSPAAYGQSQDPAPTSGGHVFSGSDTRSFLRVHVDAPEGVVVQQDTMNDDTWETVCTAPCDQLLQKGFPYRITGDGIRPSDGFVLLAPSGTRERLVVNAASNVRFVLGKVGLATGGLVAGMAGLYYLIGFTPGFPGYSGNGDMVLIGAMGIGALVFVGGALLYFGNKSTQVTQDLGATRAGIVLPGLSTTRGWSTAATEPRGLPPVLGFPIFSGRF